MTDFVRGRGLVEGNRHFHAWHWWPRSAHLSCTFHWSGETLLSGGSEGRKVYQLCLQLLPWFSTDEKIKSSFNAITICLSKPVSDPFPPFPQLELRSLYEKDTYLLASNRQIWYLYRECTRSARCEACLLLLSSIPQQLLLGSVLHGDHMTCPVGVRGVPVSLPCGMRTRDVEKYSTSLVK